MLSATGPTTSKAGMPRRHFMVIDPSSDQPELGCANTLALLAQVPVTNHQPALFGLASMHQEDMASVCGIILLGSASSVHDRSPWQQELATWLQTQWIRRVPTLAICFGHQFVATLFGGQVDDAFPDRSSFIGMRPVEFAATPWTPAVSGEVAVAHGEIVTRVPDSLQVIAHSQVAGERFAEGLAHRELPIWTYQSHPEADMIFATRQGIAVGGFCQQRLQFGHNLMRSFLDYAITL